jgi:hypothetical protein
MHRDNVAWALKNGLHCRNATHVDRTFVNIGNQDLINKRHMRQVPILPGGTLSDYVPFYFTPHSPMLLNISTGWGGIEKRSNDEIVIFVSSLPQLHKCGVKFIHTDRHANLLTAQFFAGTASIDQMALLGFDVAFYPTAAAMT